MAESINTRLRVTREAEGVSATRMAEMMVEQGYKQHMTRQAIKAFEREGNNLLAINVEAYLNTLGYDLKFRKKE